MSREELKPCPFCGRIDLLGFEPYPGSGFLGVRCRACGCIGKAGRGIVGESTAETEAAAHWNNQRGLDAADRRIAEWEREYEKIREELGSANDAVLAAGKVATELESRLATAHDMLRHFEQERDAWPAAYRQRAARTDERIADLTLRLSIATETNVADRKRIAELESALTDLYKITSLGSGPVSPASAEAIERARRLLNLEET